MATHICGRTHRLYHDPQLKHPVVSPPSGSVSSRGYWLNVSDEVRGPRVNPDPLIPLLTFN